MNFELVKNGNAAEFWLDAEAYPGVKRIAEKVCGDVELVTGIRSVCRQIETRQNGDWTQAVENIQAGSFRVVVGTIGKSPLLDARTEAVSLETIRGGREQFLFQVVQEGEQTLLIIAGSDKRGTIYGLFHLSELMGVSPWVRFSDVLPVKRGELILTGKDNVVSKEPSVKYRGFFINDEWPAFGSWTFAHFGGFTAEMYDMIFETLLRLKGNYLWPAMWTSSFSLDGPGDASARLADEYGVVMSNSHHEPCLRHSEEWDMVRGEGTPYGNEWNYVTNRKGLLQYWKDGLRRNGRFENIITIGMRGERDSRMLGENTSLRENIDLLKEIITEQRKLIRECVGEDAPQMIALYKEVEDYFYGNEGAADGLRDWDGLDGVTFMLCEDNFGNMRTLPTEEQKNRRGGWGMYYHFDYHGGPVSYEWVNSSYLPKVWDQMTEAYEFGIRDIWVVNVGDFKFQEYPVSFFMDLAYDYEKWGAHNPAAPAEYLDGWVKREFGGHIGKAAAQTLQSVMKGYTKLNHNRKPEAMSPEVYHPVHFNEAEKILLQIAELEKNLEDVKKQMPQEMLPAFWELVYYPAKGSLNVQKLQVLAGCNHYYAALGAVIANDYADQMAVCIETDRLLTQELDALLDGKWSGMGASEHIGFVHWNEEECRYPVKMYVEPANKSRLFACVKGDGDTWTAGGSWTGRTLVMKQFLTPQVSEGSIILFNAGRMETEYEIQGETPGVSFSRQTGCVKDREEIVVAVDKKMLQEKSEFVIHYAGGNIRVRIEASAEEMAHREMTLQKMTFIETDGMISMEAEHFAENIGTKAGAFCILPEYGKTRSGVKAYPCNRSFKKTEAPHLEYRIRVEREGDYEISLYTAPANPFTQWERMEFGLAVNGEEMREIPLIPEDYRSGEPSCAAWCEMVLNQIRIVKQSAHLQQGDNSLRIYALKPGFILEKIVLVRSDKKLPDSYLGPEESYYVN